MGQSIGDFFVALGFKSEDTKLRDFAKSIGNLNMESILATLGLAGVYEGISKVLTTANDATKELNQFNAATGIDTTSIQQYSKFMERMGDNIDGSLSSLKGLQKAAADVLIGKGDSSSFTRMGLNAQEIYRDPIKGMQKIQEWMRLNKFDPFWSAQTAAGMGINEKTFATLRNINESGKNLTGGMTGVETISPEEINKMKEFNSELAKMVQQIRLVGVDLAIQLEPISKDFENIGIAIRATGDALGEVIKGWGYIFNGKAFTALPEFLQAKFGNKTSSIPEMSADVISARASLGMASNSKINTYNITVNGGSDSKDIAEKVHHEIKKLHQQDLDEAQNQHY